MAVFNGFWHGETMPPHVRTCISSFIDHGHAYHLYCYRQYDAIDGVRFEDANEIYPEDEIFYYRNEDGSRGSIAAFSNLFRYKLLSMKGDWWVDTDVYCLSDVVPPGETFFGWEDKNKICTAILKFPAGHPILGDLLEQSLAAGRDLYWGQTGPSLLTKIIQERSVTHLSYPPHYAYPVDWRDYRRLVRQDDCAEIETRVAGLPFLHLWNEMFRRDPANDLDAPEAGSFWDKRLKRRE
ncbi:MAG: hypothetical protein PW843_05455 [Azospirillaceae bacterium]|nr:hypothetical protein [Azospirillaceae bacterium]